MPAVVATTAVPPAWMPIDFAGWKRRRITPDTLCETAPDAWFATYPQEWFVDAIAGTADSVVILTQRGLLRVDAAGTPVQVVALEADDLPAIGISPSPMGGWYVLGGDYDAAKRLLRVSEEGKVLWRHEVEESQRLHACAATADGGVLVGGVQDSVEPERAFWQHLDAQGVASEQVVWPHAGATRDILVRQDGSFCTGSGYGGSLDDPDREVRVTCWQGTTPLWSRVVEDTALDDRVSLSAWPDGSLVALACANRYGPYTQTVVTISADGADLQTIVPRQTSGMFGNQGWRAGHERLSEVKALPCSTIGLVRDKGDSEAEGLGEYMVWERRSAAGTQTLLRLYARGGKYQASSTNHLFGGSISVEASLFRPDGSLWLVGYDYSKSGGDERNWIYRLPAITACPEGSAVLP